MIAMTKRCSPVFSQVVFGIAIYLGALCPVSSHASTFTTLYQFQGGATGSTPASAVVEDAAGVLYGETIQAGTTNCVTNFTNPIFGCGTLYSFSRTAGLKTLILFNGPNGAYGQNSPLLVGSTLYGTAAAGGASDMGVVFSIHTDGTDLKLLHSFSGADGNQPYGPLVAGPGGILYGVTFFGGTSYPAQSYGVLYKLAPDGTFTLLHSFTNGADGANPTSLVIEKNGIVVGGALNGGYKKGSCVFVGCGTLFEYAPATSAFTILHTFDYLDGAEPVVGSVTKNGTVLGSVGAFFEFSPSSGYELLQATSGGPQAGNGATVPPVLSPGPRLTSTEPTGEYNIDGTLYQQVGKVLNILHIFSGPDGAGPQTTPLLTPTGGFIGTTAAGGASCSCGTLYEYTP
jgi:uncharacterized repeat protein (TIGR03803 family)